MIGAIVLAVVAAMFAMLLAAVIAGQPYVAPMLMLGVLLTGILFERAGYGALRGKPQGEGWEPTGERFIDDASGKPTRVWFNAATGERRYIDDSY